MEMFTEFLHLPVTKIKSFKDHALLSISDKINACRRASV
jgi:hypothetical protein